MKKLFVLFVALVMILAALPAFAQDKADWAFYGSVRMWTAWESVDSDTPPQLASTGATGSFFAVGTTRARAFTYGGTSYGDDELAWMLQTNSRIGANVKWGNIGGRFELGLGNTEGTQSVSLRLLYGTWNFGPGTFEIGQDYGSYFYLVSNLCGPGGAECNGIGFGSIYPGRVPQLALIMGGFRVSLELPTIVSSFQGTTTRPITSTTLLLTNNQTTTTVPGGTVNAAGFQEYDKVIPRIAANYTFNLGPGQFFIGGQYNTYDEIYGVNGVIQENTIDAWTLGAGTKLAFGPFYANATFQYGVNPNNAGTGPTTVYPSVQLYDPQLNKSEDSTYMAAQLILGFKLTDAITFEGGVIWQNGEVQSPSSQLSFEQNTYTYYLQMTWMPVKNFYIIPEIGAIDFDKLSISDTPDLPYGKTTWIGVKWMINF
jgi:hypothetical protein